MSDSDLGVGIVGVGMVGADHAERVAHRVSDGVLDLASTELVGDVVANAKRAWAQEWGSISLTKRTQSLFRFRELLNERKEEIAALITAEHGKVLPSVR